MRSKYILRNEGTIINWRGNWATGVDYAIGDTIYQGGISYICTAPHVSSDDTKPGVGGSWTAYWSILCQGSQGPQGIPGGVMHWRGLYSASTVYAANDGVRSAEGYGYYSLQDNNVGHTPPTDGSDNEYWSCFAWSGGMPDGWMSNGWIAAGETWTYDGADSPTFTFTISGDKTSKYAPGMRIKLTQTTVKYFIIVAISYSDPNTTVTIYGGTNYTLVNAAITDPYYSMMKSPVGFPSDPEKWTVQLVDTANRVQDNPTISTWFNIGNISISIPIGAWRLMYFVSPFVNFSSSKPLSLQTTLSTTSDGASDVTFITGSYANPITTFMATHFMEKFVNITSKTTYYINTIYWSSGTAIELSIRGSSSPTIIKAVCAYI
jgi:hypothetical protein